MAILTYSGTLEVNMAEINILVVDDEKEIAELVELYLVSDGYKVHKAYSAEEGFELLKANPIDLALLDIMMPGMDGLEMCRKIREFNNIPITDKVKPKVGIVGEILVKYHYAERV